MNNFIQYEWRERMWKVLVTTALLIVLTACETPSVKNRPGDGTVIIQMGRIGVDKVQYRHLDSVNAVRQARGLSNLSLNASLIRWQLSVGTQIACVYFTPASLKLFNLRCKHCCLTEQQQCRQSKGRLQSCDQTFSF